MGGDTLHEGSFGSTVNGHLIPQITAMLHSRWPGLTRFDRLRLPQQELLVVGAQLRVNQF